MKKVLVALLVFSYTFCFGQSKTGTREKYMNTITVAELKEHLYILSADDFEGRETSKPGQKKAAKFLEDYYLKQGLEKLKNVKQQSFPLRVRKLTGTTLNIGETIKYNSEKEMFCLDAEGLEGEYNFSKVVFAGYGISEPGVYDDYKNNDVKDALVFVYDGEPMNKKRNRSILSLTTDTYTEWSFDPSLKLQAAQTRGAKAVIIIREDYKDFLPRIKFWIDAERMELIEDDNNQKATGIPLLFMSKEGAEAILGKLEGRRKAQKSKSIETKGRLKIDAKDEVVYSENVLAFIEGSDPVLKEEIVVISAHYDHIGIVNGNINNGADDDGSGTVSAMEIAEAFITAKGEGNGVKRSVLILHVSGEEKGLFGSDYYTRHPIYPLEKTVCDLNIDMVGRLDENHANDTNYVYLIGSDMLSTELHETSERVNKETKNIKLDYTFNAEDDPNQFYYRSDHYNFAKNNIPVIFYFSGVHEDYHKPGDDPEKIVYGKMCNIAQLIFATAWDIANAPSRLKLKG
ncbi:MAG: M28 family peptidase, partial [Bacteroidota bacterium]